MSLPWWPLALVVVMGGVLLGVLRLLEYLLSPLRRGVQRLSRLSPGPVRVVGELRVSGEPLRAPSGEPCVAFAVRAAAAAPFFIRQSAQASLCDGTGTCQVALEGARLIVRQTPLAQQPEDERRLAEGERVLVQGLARWSASKQEVSPSEHASSGTWVVEGSPEQPLLVMQSSLVLQRWHSGWVYLSGAVVLTVLLVAVALALPMIVTAPGGAWALLVFILLGAAGYELGVRRRR